MSLTDSRQKLLDALTEANVRAFYGWGTFVTPCVRIFPGEPWVGVEGSLGGKRVQTWEIWVVAGKTDSGATFDDVEKLVIEVDKALRSDPTWSGIIWHRPGAVDMGGGGRYLGARGVLQTRAEV